jgi:hypothetical protein
MPQRKPFENISEALYWLNEAHECERKVRCPGPIPFTDWLAKAEIARQKSREFAAEVWKEKEK